MLSTKQKSYWSLLARCITVALGGSLLLACGQAEAPRAGGFKRPPIQVEAVAVQSQELSDVIEALGTARANESVTLSAKLTDTISKIDFEDGQLVAAGAVLVELTNTEQTALLAEAKANLDDAQRQLTRMQDLYAKRSVPVSDLDEAQARYNGMRARYDSVVARLDDRLIRAPFAGLLGFRQVSAGTLVSPNAPITTLDDISTIKLDFAVPEVHLAALEPGLSLTARSSAYPDRDFPATVQTIDSRIDPIARTALVRARIENEDGALRPGMLLTVRLQARGRMATVVPETALLQRSGGVYVYTLAQGDVATLTPIKTGVRYQGMAEVINGLQLGERVISAGVLKVRDSAQVMVRNDEVQQVSEQSAPKLSSPRAG